MKESDKERACESDVLNTPNFLLTYRETNGMRNVEHT